MASGNRLSMREGPLAQLFRKTEDGAEGAEGAADRSRRPAARCPRAAPPRRPRARPRSPRQTAGAQPAPPVPAKPDPEHHDEGPQRTAPPPEPLGGRMTEAARRAEEREERRREREQRSSRYEGVPTPEERLRSVFSADIPENILDRDPAPSHDEPTAASRSR